MWNPGIKNPIKQRPLHNEHYYSTAFSRVQITCTQNEYKYPTVFVLQKTSLTGFLQMSGQALGLQGEGWKNGWNSPFFPKKTMNAYQILKFLETSNDIDDSEIYLFIVENRNLNTTKKTKTDLTSVKETTAIEEIPAEELNNLFCHLFVKVRRRNPSFLRSCLQQMHNCCRSEISTAISSKMMRGYWFARRWLSLKFIWIVNKLLFNFVWLDFRVLFVLSSSFFS